MKEGIHPQYKETTITCVCGNVIPTRSTKTDIKTEICSQCHPFMTGKQKIILRGGAGIFYNRPMGDTVSTCRWSGRWK